ncbi:MAG: arsenate reductase (glutaredoxin) [Betaproteobacteria bacterium]
MTDTLTFLHNPRCGKSRDALALLRARGVEPRVIEYLRTPLDREAIETLLGQLGLPARGLLRTGEPIFRERFAGRDLSADECVAAMAEYPILIERPVAVRGERAVIGRPPERVLELL